MKKILLITFLFFSSSCSHKVAKIFPNLPDKEFTVVDANPDFQKGWNDGCEVGTSSGSNTFYKMFHSSTQIDGYKMVGSGDYKSGFGVGWWYCYRYIYIKNRSGLYGSFFRGHY